MPTAADQEGRKARAHESDRRRDEVTDAQRQHAKASSRVEVFVRTSSGPGRTPVLFSMALALLPADLARSMPSFWMYLRREQKIGWAGPTDLRGVPRETLSGTSITNPLSLEWVHAWSATRSRWVLTTGPIVTVLVASAAMQNWRQKLRGGGGDSRPPVGTGRSAMPFTKTEVDIHDDYVVEAVDPAWLAQGVKSPKHLMLDPDNCILCRACEDVVPVELHLDDVDGYRVQDADEDVRGGRGRRGQRGLRRGRQRLYALLGVCGPVPHRHAVLCATAGIVRRQTHDGRGPASQAAAE